MIQLLRNVLGLLLLYSFIPLNAQINRSLSENDKRVLEDQAQAKVMSFQKFCASIGNKSINKTEKSQLIRTALQLFSDENRIIQVSNLNGTVSKKKVSVYLERLSMLGYQRIQIDSYDCHIAKHFELSKEMNERYPGEEWYEGVATVIQRFRGERGDFVYEDLVERRFKVYVQKKEVFERGKKTERWIIRLGDISVTTLSNT